MPKSFEQHFAKQSEEEKSPEQIKKEKGLALAQEIKEIQERMEKEGKTIEGYKRITEIIKQITKIFESSSKETFMRGEILDFLLEMEKIHGIKIKYASDIHSQPDGTLAGAVQLSVWFNFLMADGLTFFGMEKGFILDKIELSSVRNSTINSLVIPGKLVDN